MGGEEGEKRDQMAGAGAGGSPRDGTAYLAQELNPIAPAAPLDLRARQQADDDRQSAVRTLRIGNTLLMMVRSPDGKGRGMITRYDIHGTTLREYWLENSRALAFLAMRPVEAWNILRNVGEGAYVV